MSDRIQDRIDAINKLVAAVKMGKGVDYTDTEMNLQESIVKKSQTIEELAAQIGILPLLNDDFIERIEKDLCRLFCSDSNKSVSAQMEGEIYQGDYWALEGNDGNFSGDGSVFIREFVPEYGAAFAISGGTFDKNTTPTLVLEDGKFILEYLKYFAGSYEKIENDEDFYAKAMTEQLKMLGELLTNKFLKEKLREEQQERAQSQVPGKGDNTIGIGD